jgi:hypothetical protein
METPVESDLLRGELQVSTMLCWLLLLSLLSPVSFYANTRQASLYKLFLSVFHHLHPSYTNI